MHTFKKKMLAGLLAATTLLLVPTVGFAADQGWNKSPKLYEVHTWAGKSEIGKVNGTLSDATFFHPKSAVALPDGKLLVSDSANHKLRVLTADQVVAYSGLDLGEDEGNMPI